MATKAAQTDERRGQQGNEQSEDTRQEGEQEAQAGQGPRGGSEGNQPGGNGQPVVARRNRMAPDAFFDPTAATRVALLRLARNWRHAGSTYQALNAYTKVLTQYQGTGAARAATEELIAMANELEREGKFYTALSILTKIERLM